MRILLAAKYVPTGPRQPGGVQSWIWTIRRALEAMGHECVEWQPAFSPLREQFDFGIFANPSLTKQWRSLCLETVQICHGFLDGDRPEPGFGRMFFVSESTRAKWDGKGEVVRQPIDLDFWKPKPDVVKKTAVRYSYRGTPTHCQVAAHRIGFQDYTQVSSVGYEQARDYLQQAPIVFASGRAALEAMACGAPTLIYDNRSTYQKPLMADGGLETQIDQNYSGREGIASPSIQEVTDAARKVVEKRKGIWRSWVEEHHDSKKIAERLIA